jgi:hypothetical protein
MRKMFFLTRLVFCIFVAFLATSSAYCMEFRNLDFEEADFGRGGSLLPGWTLGFDGPSFGGVLGPMRNVACLGSRCVSVHDSTSFMVHPIEGLFSVLIQGGTIPSGDTFISQIGFVPDGATTIRLLAYALSNGESQPLTELRAVADGTVLPIVGAAPSVPNRMLASIEFDISAYAGRTIDLRIEVLNALNTESNIVIDQIAFSVPEPSAWALLILGIILLSMPGALRPNLKYVSSGFSADQSTPSSLSSKASPRRGSPRAARVSKRTRAS